MKKVAKISMGVAGAAAAACIVAGAASGNGFKDVSMVSVGGILAEAEPTEEASLSAQDSGGSEMGLAAGAEAPGAVQDQTDEGSVDGLVSGAESVGETATSVSTETTTYTGYTPVVTDSGITAEEPVRQASVREVKPAASVSKTVDTGNEKKVSVKKEDSITPAEVKQHVHEWQPVFESVHHAPVTHIEKQFVKTGYEISRSEEYSYNGTQFNYYRYSKTEVDEAGEEKIVDLDCGFFINRIEVSEEEYNAALQALRDEAEARGDSDSIEASAMSSIAQVGHEADVEVVDKEAYDEDVVVGYRCSCGDKKEIEAKESSEKVSEEDTEVASEIIKEDVEYADDIEDDFKDVYIEDDCEDEDFEKVGCASRGCLLYTEDNELVGSKHECDVCGTQDVYDVDDNVVYSASDIADFISDEEAIDLLTK